MSNWIVNETDKEIPKAVLKALNQDIMLQDAWVNIISGLQTLMADKHSRKVLKVLLTEILEDEVK